MSYNPSVPATGHNGSQDYQQMQANFAQIGTSYNTDHIPLNSGSNVGLHQKVTFGINSVPSSPVSPPVMFTNVQDGLGTGLPGGVPQLFFYSGTDVQGQNNYVTGTSGSTLLPMGIILKWGTVSFSNSNTASVTFASRFPNNIFSIQLTSLTNIPASLGVFTYWNPALTGFTAYQIAVASASGTYIAIGN